MKKKSGVVDKGLKAWGLLASLLLSTSAFAAAPPGIPNGRTDGYVYANGIRIHYYRAAQAPKKPVIVMVHGITDNGLCWTTLTWKLQDSYDIYMVDTRGHGLSDPFTPADDGDALIKDIVEFVEAMGFEKPILMGHSMGAATVMRVGAEHPDLAKAIVMLDPSLGRRGPGPGRPGPRGGERPGRGRGGPPPRGSQGEDASNRLSVSMFGSPETLVAQNNYSFDDLVAKCRRDSPKWDLMDCQYWALSKKQYHGAYTNDAWQAMSGSMRTEDALEKITVPALILKADATPDVRQANEEAASVMQHGRLEHIDGAGHNLHHDELEQTVEVLRKFLSTL
jgi:pimeloyl-ACP methyl ester carboxylesterase